MRSLLFISLFTVAQIVFAQEEIPKKNVILLPIKDFIIDIDHLFVDDKNILKTTIGNKDISDEIEKTLYGEPEINLTIVSAKDEGEYSNEDKAIVAMGFLHLGRELYRSLRLNDAIIALEKGVDIAKKEFLDIENPKLVSDLFLYLGLSYMEQGNTALAHVAFKDMFFVTPEIRFQKSYFPDFIEKAIKAAAIDFLKTYPKDDPLVSLDRLEQWASKKKAYAVIFVSILGDNQRTIKVKVYEHSSQRKTMIVAHQAETKMSSPDQTNDFISRVLSAWLSCTSLPSREYARETVSRFYFDTTGVYSLYLKHPTRSVFHNAGIGIGFTFHALENLDTFARVVMVTSFPDRYNDLMEGFTGLNALVGIGYSIRWSWGRIFLHVGLDLNYLSDFLTTQNANCKFFGIGYECNEKDFFRLPSHILMGINSSFGLRIMIFGPVHTSFRTSVSTYFFPYGKAEELNFPFSVEFGLGYAF